MFSGKQGFRMFSFHVLVLRSYWKSLSSLYSHASVHTHTEAMRFPNEHEERSHDHSPRAEPLQTGVRAPRCGYLLLSVSVSLSLSHTQTDELPNTSFISLS